MEQEVISPVHEFKARVITLLGAGGFKRSALAIRDGAGVFEKVLGSGRFPHVLEIGTYRGVGTAYIAKFCQRVTTIDLVLGRMEQLGESMDRKKFWRDMGVAEKIDLRLVHNNKEKAALIASLQFDLAFIDGGKYDIAEDFESVKRCGAVLFHDVDRREGKPSLNHVYDFVMRLPTNQVQRMDIFAYWRQDGQFPQP